MDLIFYELKKLKKNLTFYKIKKLGEKWIILQAKKSWKKIAKLQPPETLPKLSTSQDFSTDMNPFIIEKYFKFSQTAIYDEKLIKIDSITNN